MNSRAVIVILFISLLFSYGCAQPKDSTTGAISIGDTQISADEFELAFRSSSFGVSNTQAARKDFLDNFITRKLIVMEARQAGLDKDPVFMKNVEFFWQQSLIKMMVDRKIKELSTKMSVTDSDVKNYYEIYKDAEFKGAPLPEVYEKIKWIILNNKQKEAMDAWLNSLKNKSKISINHRLLKIDNK